MHYKTIAIHDLVNQALKELPEPYGEDIIDEVAAWIEKNAYARYIDACNKLKKDVANNSIGWWTARLLGRSSSRQVRSKLSKIIKSYSKLA